MLLFRASTRVCLFKKKHLILFLLRHYKVLIEKFTQRLLSELRVWDKVVNAYIQLRIIQNNAQLPNVHHIFRLCSWLCKRDTLHKAHVCLNNFCKNVYCSGINHRALFQACCCQFGGPWNFGMLDLTCCAGVDCGELEIVSSVIVNQVFALITIRHSTDSMYRVFVRQRN